MCYVLLNHQDGWTGAVYTSKERAKKMGAECGVLPWTILAIPSKASAEAKNENFLTNVGVCYVLVSPAGDPVGVFESEHDAEACAAEFTANSGGLSCDVVTVRVVS